MSRMHPEDRDSGRFDCSIAARIFLRDEPDDEEDDEEDEEDDEGDGKEDGDDDEDDDGYSE